MSSDPPADLVTGATGFIGRALVKQLEASSGRTVWVLSRAEGKQSSTAIQSDLLDPSLKLPEIDRVFHFAGAAHLHPRTTEQRRAFYDVNVEGLRNLLRALDERPPEQLVLAGTVAVYGLEAGVDVDETQPPTANDPYGESKRIAEDIAAEWAERRAVCLTIARLPLVAGMDAPGNFGAMTRALCGGRYLGVGDGSARRSMILVDDLAEALPLMAGTPGVFHINDGLHPSFRELEEALAAAAARNVPPRLVLPVARAVAGVGSALESVLGRSMPFNRNALEKMTTTLTFSDLKFRQTFDFRPRSVCRVISDWNL